MRCRTRRVTTGRGGRADHGSAVAAAGGERGDRGDRTHGSPHAVVGIGASGRDSVAGRDVTAGRRRGPGCRGAHPRHSARRRPAPPRAGTLRAAPAHEAGTRTGRPGAGVRTAGHGPRLGAVAGSTDFRRHRAPDDRWCRSPRSDLHWDYPRRPRTTSAAPARRREAHIACAVRHGGGPDAFRARIRLHRDSRIRGLRGERLRLPGAARLGGARARRLAPPGPARIVRLRLLRGRRFGPLLPERPCGHRGNVAT